MQCILHVVAVSGGVGREDSRAASVVSGSRAAIIRLVRPDHVMRFYSGNVETCNVRFQKLTIYWGDRFFRAEYGKCAAYHACKALFNFHEHVS